MGDLINVPVLISSLLGFVVLYWVAAKFLFPPVLKIIDERRESIEQAFAEVDKARADVAQMKADYEAQLAQISATAQAKLQESVERGQQLAAEIRASAEDQREKLLAKTQEDIGREKDKALAELRAEAVNLSFDIAQRVLSEGLDKAQHDRLVQRFVEDLKEGELVRSEAVAKRYAEALLGLAQEHNALERLESESKILGSLFGDKLLRSFFTSPQIPRERKKSALEKALRGRVDPMLLNLARLLLDKGRIAYLPQIMREFDSMTDELRGVEEVTIVSATPLSAEQVQSIKGNVQRFTSRQELRVQTQVDPALLGGVMVRLGSRVLDGTLASRLAELRQRLSKYHYGVAGA